MTWDFANRRQELVQSHDVAAEELEDARARGTLRQAFCRFGDFAAAGEASSLKTRARAEELSNSEARAGPEMQRSRRREKTHVKVVSVGARK